MLYWWFVTEEHLRRTGVMPSDGLGFFGLILVLAYVGTVFLALPTYHLLKRLRFLESFPILVAGTLVGWLLISFADDGHVWMHPKGSPRASLRHLRFCWPAANTPRKMAWTDSVEKLASKI
jgi:hypothetical protein